MFKRLITAGLLFGMAAAAPPAFAGNCGLRNTVIERLQSKYSETLSARGLQGHQTSATMVEVWASEETGTFTVIVTSPQGVSCVVAAGTDWFQATEEAQPEGTSS